MTPIDPYLEAEYNNRALVPEHPAIFERWQRCSASLREASACTLDLGYGTDPRQKLDVFHASGSRGTVVFIHGGYWRSLDKSDFSFVAKPFVDEGLSVVAINYRLCPAVSIGEVVDDCRRALTWLASNGAGHGLNLNQVVLAGHSAGGHLVAMLFATDWVPQEFKSAAIVGGLALSGVYDLEPLLHCSMNTDIKLNHHTARAASPVHHIARISAPLLLFVGANESAAFRNQTRLLSASWHDNCQLAQDVPVANHFTIVDCLAQSTHPICRATIDLFR